MSPIEKKVAESTFLDNLSRVHSAPRQHRKAIEINLQHES